MDIYIFKAILFKIHLGSLLWSKLGLYYEAFYCVFRSIYYCIYFHWLYKLRKKSLFTITLFRYEKIEVYRKDNMII